MGPARRISNVIAATVFAGLLVTLQACTEPFTLVGFLDGREQSAPSGSVVIEEGFDAAPGTPANSLGLNSFSDPGMTGNSEIVSSNTPPTYNPAMSYSYRFATHADFPAYFELYKAEVAESFGGCYALPGLWLRDAGPSGSRCRK
ncbi:MAG: hypothetical protein ACLFNT_11425 [Spirochaetales bacterium]